MHPKRKHLVAHHVLDMKFSSLTTNSILKFLGTIGMEELLHGEKETLENAVFIDRHV